MTVILLVRQNARVITFFKQETTMTTTTSRLDSTPQLTNNYLMDIVGWLTEGDYVVLHDAFKTGRFFHKCLGNTLYEQEIEKILENTRVDYVNVSSFPELLCEGESEFFIKKAGFNECTCNLKDRVSNPKGIPQARRLNM